MTQYLIEYLQHNRLSASVDQRLKPGQKNRGHHGASKAVTNGFGIGFHGRSNWSLNRRTADDAVEVSPLSGQLAGTRGDFRPIRNVTAQGEAGLRRTGQAADLMPVPGQGISQKFTDA